MPTYLIEGKKIRAEAPLSEDEIDEIAASIKGTASTPTAAPDQSAAESARLTRQAAKPVEAPSIMQQMFGVGSPIYSVARGAVINPVLAVNEALSKVFPEPISKAATANVEAEKAAYEQGRSELGRSGFDVPQLLGGVLSPVNKLVPVGGATKLEKVGSMARAGAASAALDPVGEADDYVSQKLTQMGIGAVAGGGLMAVGQAAKTVIGIVKDLPISKAAKERIQMR
jgi:cell pole-organizing protein PopZ